MNNHLWFGLLLVMLSAYLVLSNIWTTPMTCETCRTSGKCQLPNCSCCGHAIPGRKHQQPQIVFFSFDDAVTVRNSPLYKELFSQERTNPNGCPISMTLFVSHNNTDYRLVKQMYDRGMDIAVHGINHIKVHNLLEFAYEALGQRHNLANKSQIPKEDIVGFRSPYLISYGNEHFEILQKAGFLYDSTLTITKRSLIEESPFPFTLDYGWPYPCSIPECPTHQIKGFWEVPVVSVIDKLGRYPCVYIDGCMNVPLTEEDSFNYLLDNFMSYYNMNKPPFGLNMHSTWLLREYESNPYRMRAMKRFLDYILSLRDVYIVNIRRTVEWMRHQPKLNELSNFAPFQCQSQGKSSINPPSIVTETSPILVPTTEVKEVKVPNVENEIEPSTTQPLETIFSTEGASITEMLKNNDLQTTESTPVSISHDEFITASLPKEKNSSSIGSNQSEVGFASTESLSKVSLHKRSLDNHTSRENLTSKKKTLQLLIVAKRRRLQMVVPSKWTDSNNHNHHQNVNPTGVSSRSGLFHVTAQLIISRGNPSQNIKAKDSSKGASLIDNNEDDQILTQSLNRETVILIQNKHTTGDYGKHLIHHKAISPKYTSKTPHQEIRLTKVGLKSRNNQTPREKINHWQLRTVLHGSRTSSKNSFISSKNTVTNIRFANLKKLKNLENPMAFSAHSLERHLGLMKSFSASEERNSSSTEKCQQGKNCNQPNCQCQDFSAPFPSKQIPQFVYFTFEGSIDDRIAQKLKKLFTADRVNKNGCRIKSTVFVTSEGSNYTSIKELYEEGMEIGLHGLKIKSLVSNLFNIEVALQKYLLKRYASIPESEVLGWRSPDLKSKGDNQFFGLKSKMLYDSSLFVMTNLENRTGVWPSTLDFGWHNNCLLQECPTKTYPGLWEIPAVPYVGIKKRYLCKFVDSCYNKPRTSVQTYDFILNNFMGIYKGDRTPFGVRLREQWFLPGYEENLKGLNAFIELVQELEDVYVVSVKGLINWMKNPVPHVGQEQQTSKIDC